MFPGFGLNMRIKYYRHYLMSTDYVPGHYVIQVTRLKLILLNKLDLGGIDNNTMSLTLSSISINPPIFVLTQRVN